MKKRVIFLALASASLITLTSCNATSVDSINFTINDTKYEVEPLSEEEKIDLKNRLENDKTTFLNTKYKAYSITQRRDVGAYYSPYYNGIFYSKLVYDCDSNDMYVAFKTEYYSETGDVKSDIQYEKRFKYNEKNNEYNVYVDIKLDEAHFFWSKKLYSGNAKLTYSFTPKDKFNYDFSTYYDIAHYVAEEAYYDDNALYIVGVGGIERYYFENGLIKYLLYGEYEENRLSQTSEYAGFDFYTSSVFSNKDLSGYESITKDYSADLSYDTNTIDYYLFTEEILDTYFESKNIES